MPGSSKPMLEWERQQVDQRLAALGRWVLDQRQREIGCDIDGGDLQDKAVELGLLIEVEVTKPCGEFCYCEEWDDFPQKCLRRADRLEPQPKEDG